METFDKSHHTSKQLEVQAANQLLAKPMKKNKQISQQNLLMVSENNNLAAPMSRAQKHKNVDLLNLK